MQQRFKSGYKQAMEAHILRHVLDLLFFLEQGKKAKFFKTSLFEDEKRYNGFENIYEEFFAKWVDGGPKAFSAFSNKLKASLNYMQRIGSPTISIEDIYEDFRDGFVLIRFAEKVTGKELFHVPNNSL